MFDNKVNERKKCKMLILVGVWATLVGVKSAVISEKFVLNTKKNWQTFLHLIVQSS
jgi:hypothetical protein